MINLSLLEREEVCMKTFQQFDRDGSGTLTADEVSPRGWQQQFGRAGSGKLTTDKVWAWRHTVVDSSTWAQGCPWLERLASSGLASGSGLAQLRAGGLFGDAEAAPHRKPVGQQAADLCRVVEACQSAGCQPLPRCGALCCVQVAEALGQAGIMTVDEAAMLIAKHDLNNDGVLDYSEFVHVSRGGGVAVEVLEYSEFCT